MHFINRVLTIVLMGMAITVTAQDKVERSLESFDKLRVSQGIKVDLRKGQSEKVTVEARGIDLDDIITEVRGGTLNIHLERNRYKNIDVKVEVYYKSITSIKVSSAETV